jgi:hypothetical protein
MLFKFTSLPILIGPLAAAASGLSALEARNDCRRDAALRSALDPDAILSKRADCSTQGFDSYCQAHFGFDACCRETGIRNPPYYCADCTHPIHSC